VGLTNNKVRFYKLSNGILIREYDEHAGTITALGFSPDSETIYTGSRDGTVRM